ncbi:hypothetical protein BN13_80050 [Nostocoides jenkinsii Ben 74]|uniref:DUF4031 domain-containing protein n=1 Tax=Nostocoides jenkinsii Ben 74 TaxID=1193518 RepID=A0A077MBE8_9MICO|nr:hypothetical protein BN13_80050 [Tetrasphaera jenkinsii Ben 74]
MTVYVDAAHVAASVENGPRTHTSTWCHLMADGNAELVAFAVRIGLRRNWIQREGSPFEHFDVTAGKRWQAVAAVDRPLRHRGDRPRGSPGRRLAGRLRTQPRRRLGAGLPDCRDTDARERRHRPGIFRQRLTPPPAIRA